MGVFALFDLDLSQPHFSIGSRADIEFYPVSVWNHGAMFIVIVFKKAHKDKRSDVKCW